MASHEGSKGIEDVSLPQASSRWTQKVSPTSTEMRMILDAISQGTVSYVKEITHKTVHQVRAAVQRHTQNQKRAINLSILTTLITH